MCLIIDNDVAHQVVSSTPTEAASVVRDWVEEGSGVIVHGGKLTDELIKNREVANWLSELGRSGKARTISDDRLADELAALDELGGCQSNDEHVIALARASGARFLFTRDAALMRDFKSKALVDKPRGRVFSKPSHRALLDRYPCTGDF